MPQAPLFGLLSIFDVVMLTPLGLNRALKPVLLIGLRSFNSISSYTMWISTVSPQSGFNPIPSSVPSQSASVFQLWGLLLFLPPLATQTTYYRFWEPKILMVVRRLTCCIAPALWSSAIRLHFPSTALSLGLPFRMKGDSSMGTFDEHAAAFALLLVSPDGAQHAARLDLVLQFWKANSFWPVVILQGHLALVDYVALIPAGEYTVSDDDQFTRLVGDALTSFTLVSSSALGIVSNSRGALQAIWQGHTDLGWSSDSIDRNPRLRVNLDGVSMDIFPDVVSVTLGPDGSRSLSENIGFVCAGNQSRMANRSTYEVISPVAPLSDGSPPPRGAHGLAILCTSGTQCSLIALLPNCQRGEIPRLLLDLTSNNGMDFIISQLPADHDSYSGTSLHLCPCLVHVLSMLSVRSAHRRSTRRKAVAKNKIKLEAQRICQARSPTPVIWQRH